jgi:hypothetical protein
MTVGLDGHNTFTNKQHPNNQPLHIPHYNFILAIRYEHKTLTKNGLVVDARRMNDVPQGMAVQEPFRLV